MPTTRRTTQGLCAGIGTAVLAAVFGIAPAGAQESSSTSATGIYYEVSGAGDAVVLIHGFSMDHRAWDPQMPALQRQFKVIRYDLRGHGESALPSVPYSPVEDLASVLDAAGVQRATIVGLSAGAELAVDFVLSYPERVTRLVLASPGLSGYVPPQPLTWMAPVFEAAASGDAERAARMWIATPMMTLKTNVAAAPALADIVLSNSKLWALKANPVLPLTPPAINRLSAIRSPTLVLVGGEDLPHIIAVGDLLARGVAGARLITIPGAGHILNWDAPEAFERSVLEFLAR